MSALRNMTACAWLLVCGVSSVHAQRSPRLQSDAEYFPVTVYSAPARAPAKNTRSTTLLASNDGTFLNEFPPNFDDNVWCTYELNGSLYVGGQFFVGGQGSSIGITRWDGSHWHNLENGIYSWTWIPAIYCLTPFNGDIFAGGEFISIGSIRAGSISRWDGRKWRALSTGVSGVPYPTVYAMTEFNGQLYVGGDFMTAGGIQALGIARWDGNAWSNAGSGVNARVYAMAVHDSCLYAGGAFFKAGAVGVPHVARWNGTSWSPVGTQADGIVYALATYNGSLYAGGEFAQADGNTVNHMMRWNGSVWQPVAGGVNDTVRALSVNDGELLVGGWFTSAGGASASYVAGWDGAVWHPLGSGTNFPVLTLGAYGGDLVAGGSFTRAGVVGASRLARWTGQDWRPISDGFNGAVYDFTTDHDTLYAGGVFSTAPGTGANRVARWDPVQGWNPLGQGISGPLNDAGDHDFAVVHAMAAHRGDLWVGGAFTSAGGVYPTPNLARWDGRAWFPGAASIDGPVWDLIDSDGDLYAGGEFRQINGVSTARIARLDNYSWQPVGVGMNGAVYVMSNFEGDLYAAGNFTTAGGLPAYRLARWDGSTWTAVADKSGSGPVYALAWFNDHLVVGGDFTVFNGVSANNVIEWDGLTWAPLAAGLNHAVYALANFNGALYAGGDFYASGTQWLNHIAKWDGAGWSPLGQGMGGDGTVYALVGHAHTLFVGGEFSVADTVPSGFVARWKTDNPNPVTFLSYSARWHDGRAEIEWESLSGDNLRFQVYRRDKSGGVFSALSLPIGGSGTHYVAVDGSAVSTESYVYRVVARSADTDVASFDVPLSGQRPPFALHQNSPNPFRKSTVIRFELEEASNTTLVIYDVTGAAVRTLLSKPMPAGWNAFTVEAGDLPAGVYFYRLRAGKQEATRKFVVLK